MITHPRTTNDQENDGVRQPPGRLCVCGLPGACTHYIILYITEGKIKTQYPDSRGLRGHFDWNVMKEQ